MWTHLRTYAKSYVAGGTALAIQPFANDIMAILIWLCSLLPVPEPPIGVKAALTNIVTAFIVTVVTWAVPNKRKEEV